MKPSIGVERVIRAQVGRGHDPFYLYDRGVIRTTCRKFAALPYPLCSVYFACMANAHPTFLGIVRDEGLGLFVNSLPHLRHGMAMGFTGEQIVFAASAMDEPTMWAAHDAGAKVNLDSLNQVARWQQMFPGMPFGIRCNIGGLIEAKKTRGGYFIGRESRLGMTPEELLTLSGERRVTGLHLYVGTDITDIDYFSRCYQILADFAVEFPALAYLDVGGGFGLQDEDGHEFDIHRYGLMTDAFMRHVSGRLGRPIRMILEPGRLIGARAGWFVCRVVDTKQRGNRQLIGVNASSAQFPRPLFYPDSAQHPVTLLHTNATLNGKAELPTSVYGCSTYSRDFLAHDVILPRAEIGDIIVLGDAGSYCAAAYTHFLGFPQPREIFDDCEPRSRQETAADVLFPAASGV
jgi:diaminopimelate decarboxylase